LNFWDAAWSSLINGIDVFNNIIQFPLSFLTVFLLIFFYTMPYRKPLRDLLGSLGLRGWMLLEIIWLYRKDPRFHIRAFIELGMIRSLGIYKNKAWWTELKKEFMHLLDEKTRTGEFVIEIQNTFNLTASEVTEQIRAYFEYMKRERSRKHFAISERASFSFVSSIIILDGYTTPITFIHGLQDRYNDDWSKIIGKYSSVFNQNRMDSVIPSELYLSYNWLMWGPSYQVNYENPKEYYKLIQFGYGDESNSIPLVVKDDKDGQELWDTIQAQIKRRSFGVKGSLKAKLYEPASYMDSYRDRFDHRAQPFIKRLSNGDRSFDFLVEYETLDNTRWTRHQPYFFSAYLWIMFRGVSGQEESFDPVKTVTFFEHANLADPENYSFLLHSLIEKSFSYFENIFSRPEYRDRQYEFCLAMNQDIEKLFLNKLQKIRDDGLNPLREAFRSRLNEQSSFTIVDVLDAFDNHFDEVPDSVEFVEVSYHKPDTIKMLLAFYAEIYLYEFLDPNERESLDNMLDYLKKKSEGWYGSNNYHILLMVNKENQEVLAGSVFDYLEEPNCGVIEFIAVRKEHRRKGYGERMVKEIVGLLRSDAAKTPHRALDWMICEVNNPLATDMSLETMDPSQRLRFWEKLHFRILKFHYYQPALSEDKEPVGNLHLLGTVFNPNWDPLSVSSAMLAKAVSEYARLAMRIPIPERHPVVKRMLDEIMLEGKVELRLITDRPSKAPLKLVN
jgi:ribosomal protein S18 acetylase RimI-like enzyme